MEAPESRSVNSSAFATLRGTMMVVFMAMCSVVASQSVSKWPTIANYSDGAYSYCVK